MKAFPLKVVLLVVLALAVSGLRCAAQQMITPSPNVHGCFFVSVDDSCTIFVNGEKIYHAGLGSSRSPETALRAGDRVLVHLVNDMGPRHFLMLFESNDGQMVVSFRRSDYRIVPTYSANDFTTTEYEGWTTMAKLLRHKPRLPVKSYSEAVWGNLDNCYVATIVKPEMITQQPK